MKKIILALLALIFLISCTTVKETLNKLRLDMTYEEVIEICGNPDGVFKTGEDSFRIEYYGYYLTTAALERSDLFIDFEDNSVVGYGSDNTRTTARGGAVIVNNTF